MAQYTLSIILVFFILMIQTGSTDWVNVSDACKKSLELYTVNLEIDSDDDNWALQMWDASSKMPVGLLSYNFGELGNFDQCIRTESADHMIKGKYCLGQISVQNDMNSSTTDDRVQMIWNKILHAIRPGIHSTGKIPTWAICVPHDCSNEDVMLLLAIDKTHAMNFDSVSCQTREDANPPLDAIAIFGIVTLAAILYLMIMCTSYDLYCQKNNKKPVHPVLLLFSLHTNTKKMFVLNKNSGDLSCLNGIRVLSMAWIVVYHCFSVSPQGPVFNSKTYVGEIDHWGSMLIVSAPIACDTFLLIGGTLVVYVFFKHNGFEKFQINLFQYYLHRYLRVTPVMLGAVLISACLLKYMGSGPNWNTVTIGFGDPCRTYWWSALLYVQNYVNVETMCVGHSWYLNVDFQLYLISPIFLYLLSKYTKTGLALIVLLIAGTIGISFYTSYSEELSAIITNYNLKGSSQSYMNDYYLKTHTRAAPWLLGLILGYILVKKRTILHSEPKINKIIVLVLWVMCLVTLGICVIGGHGTLRETHYDRLGNAFYIALVRPCWSLCVAWMIWACANDYGGIINTFLSIPIFQVFNKFTYSMYIIHVTLLYMLVFGRKLPVYVTIFDMFFSFFGLFTLVFLLSIVWVLAFESPMNALERIIFSKPARQ